MINPRSLRFRLALWYFCTVTIICTLAGVGYWLAVRSALNHAMDQNLRYRIVGLHQFIEDINPAADALIASRLQQISPLGELYQVFGANGALIAQSSGLERHHVPRQPPPDLGFKIRYATGGTDDFELRLAWQKVTIGGRTLVIAVADPQRKYEGVLTAFTTVLLVSTPLILALATICGLWLGSRALSPVARITEDARAITENNLSSRLAVPDSKDEIQHLSKTLNEMLDRIEQSFTRTRQFTADASHELRAPMTLISTAAQFSLRRERSHDELLDSMRKILRESERTTVLIDDLLLLARGDAGRETDEMAPLDAAPLLRDLTEQATAMAAAKDIHVTLQLSPASLNVRANESSLRRLLLILVDNAIKYTQPSGRVMIEAAHDRNDVKISVADTGPGIAQEDQPHVFERFWRADKVRSRQAGGTGLGLAIAKQLADQHAGCLSLESDPGRGSVFTLRLPAVL